MLHLLLAAGAWARLARVLFVNNLLKSAISPRAFCCQVIAF